MKRVLQLFVLITTIGGLYVAASHISGGALPSLGLAIGGERGVVRRLSLAFLEDIQFKDFVRAASYHAPDKQESVDIPFVIQRLFQVKPEALDIMSYEIVFADLDSSSKRARVKTRVKVKDLLREEIRDQELMLYFERTDAHAPWFMKLEDSLRNLEAETGKKS